MRFTISEGNHPLLLTSTILSNGALAQAIVSSSSSIVGKRVSREFRTSSKLIFFMFGQTVLIVTGYVFFDGTTVLIL